MVKINIRAEPRREYNNIEKRVKEFTDAYKLEVDFSGDLIAMGESGGFKKRANYCIRIQPEGYGNRIEAVSPKNSSSSATFVSASDNSCVLVLGKTLFEIIYDLRG